MAGTLSAAKWSTVEITLTAANQYSNPYTQTGVTATFSGPDGPKTVNGFWDGGTTWKIRFTPTAEGTWTYLTRSTDPPTGCHEPVHVLLGRRISVLHVGTDLL
ncbi:MAG: DUF5060 domain-containing protein [Gemmatimonadales bacterium]